MQKNKLKVYIAGPIRLGDFQANVKQAIYAGELVLRAGHVPFIPHAHMLWEFMYNHPQEVWLEWDKEWLEVCDAVIRLPGKSVGADAEVELAKRLGKRIYGLEEFLHEQDKELYEEIASTWAP